MESLSNDFPEAREKLRDEISAIKIICLLKREKSDIEDSVAFNKRLNELKLIYKSVYILDENQPNKINLFASTTRLYVNKHKVVTNIGVGTSLIENGLLEKIKVNTGSKT